MRRHLLPGILCCLAATGCGSGSAAKPNAAPVLTAPPAVLTVDGDRVTLDATAADPEGGAVVIDWTVAEDAPGPVRVTGTGGHVTARFARVGSYRLTVTARDAAGAASRSVVVVEVSASDTLVLDATVTDDGTPAVGVAAGVLWKPGGEIVSESVSDQAGVVSFTDLLGTPDDFTVVVAGTPQPPDGAPPVSASP